MENISMFAAVRAGIVFVTLAAGTALYMKRGRAHPALFLCGVCACGFVRERYEAGAAAADAVHGCLSEAAILFVISAGFVLIMHMAAADESFSPAPGVFGYFEKSGAGVSDVLAFLMAAGIFSRLLYGCAAIIMLLAVCMCNAWYRRRGKRPEVSAEQKGHREEKPGLSFMDILMGHADLFIPSVLSAYCATGAACLAVRAAVQAVSMVR